MTFEMDEITISFIIPVYNTQLERLRACIASILNIDLMKYEIIVIDDGSRPELSKAYDEYFNALGIPNLKWFRQPNKGVSSARNVGIAQARGQYVMFLDSDDRIDANVLEQGYSKDIVLFDLIHLKGRRRILCPIGIDPEKKEGLGKEFLWKVMRGMICGCRYLYRRDFLERNAIRFEEGCALGEDAGFNFACAVKNPTVEYVNKPLYQYDYSSKTFTKRWRDDPRRMIKNEADRFARFFSYLPIAFPEDLVWREALLLTERIRGIYRNAIELCGAGQATPECRAEIERLMSELPLPTGADRKTRNYYAAVRQRRWRKIAATAKLRAVYLWARKI